MSSTTSINRWPIVLFSIPFAAVLFGIVMITTALYFPDDMVVDQYYKEGMAINERIADSRLATELGIDATVYFEGRIVTAEITGSTPSAHKLNFFHVTDKNRDFSLQLVKQDNQYRALQNIPEQMNSDAAGVWYVELVGIEQGWRIRDRLETPVVMFSLGAAR